MTKLKSVLVFFLCAVPVSAEILHQRGGNRLYKRVNRDKYMRYI